MEKKQSSIEWLGLELNIIFHDLTPELWEQVEVKFQQAKAMHKEEIESNNKINLAINEFERLKSNAGSIRDIIYLDGVLAVLDSIKNETFGGNNE